MSYMDIRDSTSYESGRLKFERLLVIQMRFKYVMFDEHVNEQIVNSSFKSLLINMYI